MLFSHDYRLGDVIERNEFYRIWYNANQLGVLRGEERVMVGEEGEEGEEAHVAFR